MINHSPSYKPIIFEIQTAHRRGLILAHNNGNITLTLPNKQKVTISKHNQYDLTQATIFGLNERLTMFSTSPLLKNNQTLRDLFNLEWQKFNQKLSKTSKMGFFEYGYFAYYPNSGDLVRYSDPFWHRIVSVASNSKLITDPKQKLSWKDIQDIFQNTTIGIAGCSVGNSIAHTVCMDIRPNHIKIADKSLFKMENINRVRLTYKDIVHSNALRKNQFELLLKNKADTTAEQIYKINPFTKIYVYNEGLNEKNIEHFLAGGKHEPKVQVIIEEVDDPRTKILIRQKAREKKIPLLMVTDVGSSVQLDIRRFDLNPKLSLTHNTSDSALIQAMENIYLKPGDRKIFFAFVDALIGKDYRQNELKKIIENQTEIPTSTIIPQLGSTINTASGIISEAVARIILGHQYPTRVIFNKHTFSIKKFT